MGSPDVSCVTPVDLNDFFDGDGKIYGYQGLKVVFFLSFFLSVFWFLILVVLFWRNLAVDFICFRSTCGLIAFRCILMLISRTRAQPM